MNNQIYYINDTNLVDMSLLEDDVNYKEFVEDYVSRVCFLRISRAGTSCGVNKESNYEALEYNEALKNAYDYGVKYYNNLNGGVIEW